MSEPLSPTSEPRNLERCLQCGYRLTGLPDAGRCPECGHAYDQSAVVLRGWGYSTLGTGFATGFGKRGWPAVLSTLLPGLSITLSTWSMQRVSGPRGPVWLVFLSLVAAIACLVLSQRRRGGIPPLILILQPNGWLLRCDPAARGAMILHGLCLVTMVVSFLTIYARRSLTGALALAAFCIVIFCGSLLWRLTRTWRLHREPADGIPHNVIAPNPWGPAARLSFQKIGPDLWQLTLSEDRAGKRWSFRLKPNPTRLLFDATLSHARVLQILSQAAAWPVTLEVLREWHP